MDSIFNLNLNRVVEMFSSPDNNITIQYKGVVETLQLFEGGGVVELVRVSRNPKSPTHYLRVFLKDGGMIEYLDLKDSRGLSDVFKDCLNLYKERENA